MPQVKISVDNKELQQGLKATEQKVSSSFSKMSKSAKDASTGTKTLTASMQRLVSTAPRGLQGITGALAKIGPLGLAAGAAIAGIGLAVVKAAQGFHSLMGKLDNMAKAAKSVDMTAVGYSRLEYASRRAGVSMEKMLSIVQRIDYAVVKASERRH